MLLVVVDDEKTQHQQPAQDAGGNFAQDGGNPKGAGQSGAEEGCGREEVPPTLERHIRREPPGSQNQIGPSACGLGETPGAKRRLACQVTGLVGGGWRGPVWCSHYRNNGAAPVPSTTLRLPRKILTDPAFGLATKLPEPAGSRLLVDPDLDQICSAGIGRDGIATSQAVDDQTVKVHLRI